MQVMSINNNSNQSFGALKSIHINGDTLKRHSEYTDRIISAVKNDPKVADFFKKWDGDMILISRKFNASSEVTASIYYRDLPLKNKVANFIKSLKDMFKAPKKIGCSGYGLNLEEAVLDLEKSVKERGVLRGQIDYINKNI